MTEAQEYWQKELREIKKALRVITDIIEDRLGELEDAIAETHRINGEGP